MNLWRMFFIMAALSSSRAQSANDQIKAALNVQVAAWNSADLSTFASTYAPKCILVGKTISRVTRAQVLAHYREKYPNSAAMGHLTFSELQTETLDEKHAIAIAHWHLDRNAAAGGPVGGVFSLVLERQEGTWLIILDHTN